jgi:hypothetical protein
MGIAKGTLLNGIRSPEDLLARSHVDDESGCWRWRGHCCRGTPFMTLRIDGHARKYSGRRAALILSGKPPKSGQVAFPTDKCSYHDCVRPECARWGSIADRMAYVARQGKFREPERLARLARANDTRRKITEAQRLEVLLSDETGVELAQRLPIGQRQISYIRTRSRTTPAASVFDWRG